MVSRRDLFVAMRESIPKESRQYLKVPINFEFLCAVVSSLPILNECRVAYHGDVPHNTKARADCESDLPRNAESTQEPIAGRPALSPYNRFEIGSKRKP